ncbi:MAG TPA: SRPBCC family protein [Pseudonocardiaceae bacterium]|jgi:hypothetical protein
MISNVHQRLLPGPMADVGRLIDAVAEPGNALWPSPPWPAIVLDRPLGPGAAGGHGPIRYRCVSHQPGRRAEFEFRPPTPVRGTHAMELIEHPEGVLLQHTLIAEPVGLAGLLAWTVVFRALHDAVLEDLLDRAETALGRPPKRPAQWSPYVRLLRGGYELFSTTTSTSKPSPTVVVPGPSNGS